MGCVPVPKPPVVALPGGISITPPAPPAIPDVPGACCKLQTPAIPLPPIPLPALVTPVIMATITEAIDGVLAHLDSLTPDCPLETEDE